MANVITTPSGEKVLTGEVVNIDKLTATEREILSSFEVIKVAIPNINKLYSSLDIVECIAYVGDDWLLKGCIDVSNRRILICRACLNRMEDFLGTLLHELAHGIRMSDDITKNFEEDLTKLLGYISASFCNTIHNNPKSVIPARTLDNRTGANVKCKCMTCYMNRRRCIDAHVK